MASRCIHIVVLFGLGCCCRGQANAAVCSLNQVRQIIWAGLAKTLTKLTVAGSDIKNSFHHLDGQALLLLEQLPPPGCDPPQPNTQLLTARQLLLQLRRQPHAPVHTTPAPEGANTTQGHTASLRLLAVHTCLCSRTIPSFHETQSLGAHPVVRLQCHMRQRDFGACSERCLESDVLCQHCLCAAPRSWHQSYPTGYVPFK